MSGWRNERDNQKVNSSMATSREPLRPRQEAWACVHFHVPLSRRVFVPLGPRAGTDFQALKLTCFWTSASVSAMSALCVRASNACKQLFRALEGSCWWRSASPLILGFTSSSRHEAEEDFRSWLSKQCALTVSPWNRDLWGGKMAICDCYFWISKSHNRGSLNLP